MPEITYEIEMLSIGDADAFIINYINDKNEYLIVIDSGNTEQHGQMVVNQIEKYYPGRPINLAINTHLDQDHISGFKTILESDIEVKEFWIHNPWRYFDEKEILNEQLKIYNTPIYESLLQSKRLIANLNGYPNIKIKEPFEGETFETFIEVLGPNKEYYKSLVPNFRGFNKEFVNENYNPKLADKSAENNSSAIILFKPTPNDNYLFTGDSGPLSMEKAWHKFPKKIEWLSVPHHGSEKNFYDKILTLSPTTAYISAINDKLHPSKTVVDKLNAINCDVYCSFDGNKLHSFGTGGRGNPSYYKCSAFTKP